MTENKNDYMEGIHDLGVILNSLLSCYKKKIGRKGELVTTNGSS